MHKDLYSSSSEIRSSPENNRKLAVRMYLKTITVPCLSGSVLWVYIAIASFRRVSALARYLQSFAAGK